MEQRMMGAVACVPNDLFDLTNGIPAEISRKTEDNKGGIRAQQDEKSFSKGMAGEKMLFPGYKTAGGQKQIQDPRYGIQQDPVSCQGSRKFYEINRAPKAIRPGTRLGITLSITERSAHSSQIPRKKRKFIL